MLDNALINLIATQLEAASAKAGWNYVVVQKDQPTQEGIPTDPTIFFEKLFDRPFGFAEADYAYDSVADNFAETETQYQETTFQISAMVIQDPNNLTLPTASDVANYMKMFMLSRFNLGVLRAQNVGVIRVTDVRNPYIEDDRHRFEAVPSFDLTLTHNLQIVNTVGAAVKAVENGIFPI